jgi:hypothetical protein
MRWNHSILTVSLILLPLVDGEISLADETLKGIACPSVHLSYPAPTSVAFYQEAMIEKTAAGTYFMVCGWNRGYFGMQELANGKKRILFSVWDPGDQDDPKTVKDEQRVKLLHRDESVRVGRFGGEGTGGQSFFDFDWKIGETYQFLVTAKAADTRSEYSGFFYDPDNREWRHLVTFSTPANGELLKECYSFVEDFKRDKVSTTNTRRARFANGWVQGVDGDWQRLTKARFTADANPEVNIDGGIDERGFFLAKGGLIENEAVKLGMSMELPESARSKPRPELPKRRTEPASP